MSLPLSPVALAKQRSVIQQLLSLALNEDIFGSIKYSAPKNLNHCIISRTKKTTRRCWQACSLYSKRESNSSHNANIHPHGVFINELPVDSGLANHLHLCHHTYKVTGIPPIEGSISSGLKKGRGRLMWTAFSCQGLITRRMVMRFFFE